MIKRLKAYEQKDCAKRVKLRKDSRIARANETVELADRERVLRMLAGLFEETESEADFILMQFSDVPEPDVVTLMQFKDVPQPDVLTLMQFEDVAEPEAVTLIQFSDVTDPDEDEDEEQAEQSEGDEAD